MMETVKKVEKRVKFDSLEKIVHLQLMLYSFTEGIHLSPGDYSLLVHVAIHGYDRRSTPNELVEKRVFLHKQSVRNTRNKLVDKGLLVEGPRHIYKINPDIKLESRGHIMIDLKAINI